MEEEGARDGAVVVGRGARDHCLLCGSLTSLYYAAANVGMPFFVVIRFGLSVPYGSLKKNAHMYYVRSKSCKLTLDVSERGEGHKSSIQSEKKRENLIPSHSYN